MTNAAQLLDEVSRLLEMLPNVTVLTRHAEAHEAILEITLCGAATEMRIQRMCDGAKVGMDPPVRGIDAEDCGERTRHVSICASTEAFDEIEFGSLQLPGIDAVWHLQRAGAMLTDVANERLKRWCGAQVDDQGDFILTVGSQ